MVYLFDSVFDAPVGFSHGLEHQYHDTLDLTSFNALGAVSVGPHHHHLHHHEDRTSDAALASSSAGLSGLNHRLMLPSLAGMKTDFHSGYVSPA